MASPQLLATFLDQALWWEQQRANQIAAMQQQGANMALLNAAFAQQQTDMQRLSQLQNAYMGGSGGSCASTMASMSTCGSAWSDSTASSFNAPQFIQPTRKKFQEIPDEPVKRPARDNKRTRSGGWTRSPAERKAEITQAKLEADERRAVEETRFPFPKEGLTHKNSPLFGESVCGRYYRWRFDSPFRPLMRWFTRWAWGVHRGIA